MKKLPTSPNPLNPEALSPVPETLPNPTPLNSKPKHNLSDDCRPLVHTSPLIARRDCEGNIECSNAVAKALQGFFNPKP